MVYFKCFKNSSIQPIYRDTVPLRNVNIYKLIVARKLLENFVRFEFMNDGTII